MTKTLIAIAGCHQNENRANNQRVTWVPDATDDVRLFVGKPHNPWVPDDTVQLDCPDSYPERKRKVLAIIRWALDHGYDRLIKIDDDVYLRPERLATLPLMDYGGFTIRQKFYDDGVFLYEKDTTLGAFYVVSKHAMGLLLGPDKHQQLLFEDLWVSKQLADNGIIMTDLRPRLGYVAYNSVQPHPDFPYQTPPLPSNNIVASWEYRGFYEMLAADIRFKGIENYLATKKPGPRS